MRRFLLLLDFLILTFLFVGCDVNPEKYSKIWAHRVNNPEDANKKIKRFYGIEIDLAYDKQTREIFVSHDIEFYNKLTFREFLAKIKTPEKPNYWLDVKNLEDNPGDICDTIIALADEYGFSNKFFVENWHSYALEIAKMKGIKTSLWVDDIFEKDEMDSITWSEKVVDYMTVANPDFISANYRMKDVIKIFLPDMQINLWQTPAEFNDENAEITREICRDPHVKVLLVDYDKPISY